ncbi:MAG: aspartate aminotransferase family protein [Rhodothermaceae bacterium]
MDRYHNRADIEKISKKLVDILEEYYVQPEKNPVVPKYDKQNSVNKFSEAEPPQKGEALENVINYFKTEILSESVKTWHPMFLNQMFPGVSFPSIVGDYMASMMNPTLATWEIAPVASIIERNVVKWMAEIIGMPEGSSGVMVPGGSLANLMALTIARNKISPEIAKTGITPNNVIICSETAHYSVKNAANLLGIGINNLVTVKTNERNEIDSEDFKLKLKYCEENNLNPFATVLIIGNTVTGGTDKLREIAELCKERKIHIHVDAAFGGGLSLTSDSKDIFDGIELADSICWDTHKWFHTSLTSTALLVPDATVLKDTFNTNADYLFHPDNDGIEEAEDLGKYTLLCGKRFDSLKTWILWKTLGTEGLREIADSRIKLVNDFYNTLDQDPDFTPSYRPKTPIQCFRFTSQKLENASTEYLDRMHRWIREQFKVDQKAFFNVANLNGKIHFRAILVNPLTTIEHLNFIMKEIKVYAEKFIEENPV